MADSVGYTAITSAFQCGHTSVLRLLLADDRVDPNITDQAGNTVLSLAASEMNISHLKLLLANERTLRIRLNDPTGGEYPTRPLRGSIARERMPKRRRRAHSATGMVMVPWSRPPCATRSSTQHLNQRGLNASSTPRGSAAPRCWAAPRRPPRCARPPSRGSSSEAQATRATYDAAYEEKRRRARPGAGAHGGGLPPHAPPRRAGGVRARRGRVRGGRGELPRQGRSSSSSSSSSSSRRHVTAVTRRLGAVVFWFCL